MTSPITVPARMTTIRFRKIESISVKESSIQFSPSLPYHFLYKQNEVLFYHMQQVLNGDRKANKIKNILLAKL
jgi:hypothetical protein